MPFSLRDHLAETAQAARAPRRPEGPRSWSATSLPDVPNVVVGDPGRLRQVLVNLVGNAIKFTDRGQVLVQVEVESAMADAHDTALLRDRQRHRHPADKQRAIFEPFRQADGSTTRRFGGTGLGLAISSTLVDLMGGRIWLESTPREGSTFHFTVRLGITDARPEPPALSLDRCAGAHRRRQRGEPARSDAICCCAGRCGRPSWTAARRRSRALLGGGRAGPSIRPRPARREHAGHGRLRRGAAHSR